jgi:hypothetical protein
MAHFGYGGFFRLTPKNNKICLRIFYQANGFCSVFYGFVAQRNPKNLSPISLI